MIKVLLLLAALVLSGHPRTLSFLEEHSVQSGVYQTFGARYVVPQGRTATVTGLFCELNISGDQVGQNNIQVSVFIQAKDTVRGLETPWQGMNPLSCSNAPGKPTAITSGATIQLLPGDIMQTFYTNRSNHSAFIMLGAHIVEEDLR